MVVDYNVATYIVKEKEMENEEEKGKLKRKRKYRWWFFTLGNINNSEATTTK